MPNSIIPAKTAIETFRDAGYKNTASALAELIDNSIEAGAKNIQVIAFEEKVAMHKRNSTQIRELAVYDDGCGMTPETLQICLQFGNGTRLNSRTGMGRFGIGLPNASVSQARKVDVYSWQDKKFYHTFLDVDQIKEENLQTVNPVEEVELPEKYLNEIEGELSDSGTLIVWSKCDRLDMVKSRTLYKILNKDLCRIYRHFLDDDNRYGNQVKINLVATGKDRSVVTLYANDPLYLMTPNNVPGYETQALNVMYGEVINIPIVYDSSGNTASVEMRFTIALPETQALGGGSIVGSHYRNNTGISFVRAAREIDFNNFGFFNDRDERERWWGCEIRFEPILDELFGVTNNKQAVRGVDYIDEKEFKTEHAEDFDELLEQDLKLKLRLELSRIFSNNHRKLMECIKERGAGKRGGSAKERAQPDTSTRIANTDLQTQKTKTKSSEVGKSKSEDEKLMEWKNRILESDTTLTDKNASQVAPEKINLAIEKDFKSWPGSQFIGVETTGSTCVLVINRSHLFFNSLYEPLLDVGDDQYINALDLTLMSYARMEDELYSRIDDLDEMRDIWGRHLKSFLSKLKDNA
ncbi:ATP-binding protein [Limisalsivibrio acetivorans]|uniref:ATP-binding protein n=1 Tax=Limisalsivibrio acetivorans TaxID=1304888 RepID=UPI0003B76319|nr:ATP-binding protein [Limisalsivibrio acetivorans]